MDDNITIQIKIFFENPFWIGICERVTDQQLSVCKITFGAEPNEPAVLNFILENWYQLKFSPSINTVVKEKKRNPKRIQRLVYKQMNTIGVGTKSQQALKLQQEAHKTERRTRSRLQKEEEKERLFALKQQKRKKKHRGR